MNHNTRDSLLERLSSKESLVTWWVIRRKDEKLIKQMYCGHNHLYKTRTLTKLINSKIPNYLIR